MVCVLASTGAEVFGFMGGVWIGRTCESGGFTAFGHNTVTITEFNLDRVGAGRGLTGEEAVYVDEGAAGKGVLRAMVDGKA